MKVQAEYVVVGVGAGEVARHEDAERQAGPRHHLALAHLQAHDLKYSQCLEADLVLVATNPVELEAKVREDFTIMEMSAQRS